MRLLPRERDERFDPVGRGARRPPRPSPSVRKTSRRFSRFASSSEIAALDLFREIVGRAPREREDRQRRVLLRRVRKRRSVDHEDVLDFVHLVEARSSADRFGSAPMRQVPCSWIAEPMASSCAALVVHEHAAGGLDDLLDGVGHVLGHLPLVLADPVVDPRQRHAVAVDARRIHGDAVVRVRQDLAERMDLEPGRMPPLDRRS